MQSRRVAMQCHDNSGAVWSALSLIVCDLVTGEALSRQEEGLSHGNHFWICPLCNSWIPLAKKRCVYVCAHVSMRTCRCGHFLNSHLTCICLFSIGCGLNVRHVWIRHPGHIRGWSFFGLIVKLMRNFRFVKIFTKVTSLTCNKVDDEIPVRRICVNPIMLIKNKLLSTL